MGKIPKKKHKGIKDPYKQQEVRQNLLKNKVNQKPGSTEVQELPRKLQAIASFNNQNQDRNISSWMKKKKKRRHESLIDGTKFVAKECEERGMSRPTKMVPVMKQRPYENHDTFLKRVDQMTKAMVKESKFEDKYHVEVMRSFQGQVTSVIPREQLEQDINNPQGTTRSQKRRLAKKEREQQKKLKRKKKVEDDDEFSYFQDKIEFGDIVSEPPNLDTKKLTSKVNGGVPKPKTFLFMDKLKPRSSPGMKKCNKKVKNVSLGHHRMLEEERQRVVEAYHRVKTARTHAVPSPIPHVISILP